MRRPDDGASLSGMQRSTRGTLLALIVIPVGVALWVAAWSVGLFASIASIVIVLLALVLYRWGAGSVSTPGDVVAISAISVVTIVLGMAAGLLWQVAAALGVVLDVSPLEALGNAKFGELLALAVQDSGGRIVLALVIALGLAAVTVLRFVVPRRGRRVAHPAD